MTIGFFVFRKSFLKVVGSLIQVAIERGHRVVLLWNPTPSKPGETVHEEDLSLWPEALAALYEPALYEPQRGTQVLQNHKVEAVVDHQIYPHFRNRGILNQLRSATDAGVKFFSVSYLYDTVTHDPESYLYLAKTFYVSEYQRQMHWDRFADQFSRVAKEMDLREWSAVCGLTMLDQFALVNPAQVRRKYGIPECRLVVLLMSLKMQVPDPWRRIVWGEGGRLRRSAVAIARGRWDFLPEIWKGSTYRSFAEALKRFCRRNDALLVVKSRLKNNDPAWLRELADVFLYDEDYYPYTSLQLLSISDLCVHFQSGTVLEAAFAGVPSLSIAVSQEHLAGMDPQWVNEIFTLEKGSLQNWPGIVYGIDHEAAIDLVTKLTLDDFRVDKNARKEYVEKFVGFDDTHSSERVMGVIEHSMSGG